MVAVVDVVGVKKESRRVFRNKTMHRFDGDRRQVEMSSQYDSSYRKQKETIKAVPKGGHSILWREIQGWNGNAKHKVGLDP